MRVLLGMSGGVDSTFAAVRLIEQGYEVEGAVLKMHEYTETKEACSAAAAVGIPIHEIDCTEVFDKLIKTYFIDEYAHGRTPNPCVLCNSEVKFKFLAEYAKNNGFDNIATGHYARIVRLRSVEGKEFPSVAMGVDTRKDQSYMLWRLDTDILDMLLLPLCEERKTRVVEKARACGLDVADRAESQEICFIPDGNYVTFIEERLGEFPCGSFVDSDGNTLGEHKGIIRYTVGQRKGLGISLGERMFVTDINSKSNTVTLSPTPKESRVVTVDGLKLHPTVLATEKGFECLVKVRYLAPPVEARVTVLGEGRAKVELSRAARSVTPGQSLVMYRDGAVIGGGIIHSAQ